MSISLRAYRLRLVRSKFKLPCKFCNVVYSPLEYCKHVNETHSLPKKTHCPWCFQKFEDGMKANVGHLLDCFKKLSKPPVVPIVEPTTVEPCKSCLEFDSPTFRHNFLGRKRINGISKYFYKSFSEPDYLHDPLFKTGDNYPIFTESCGLGSDVGMLIHKFQELGESVLWYHVIVNADAFESFAESMRYEDLVYLLPFWCLCDGSSNPEKRLKRHVHHRHGILVSSEEGKPFERVWKRVKPTGRSVGACKRFKPIKNLHHFTNVLNYVGRSRSRCGGLENGISVGKNRHYHIHRPFCAHARLFMRMCYPGGLERYLIERHGNEFVHRYNTLTLKWDKNRHSMWMVRVGEMKNEPRYCTLPLVDTAELWSLKERIGGENLQLLSSVEDEYHKLSKPQQRCAEEVKACRDIAEREKQVLLDEMENACIKKLEKEKRISRDLQLHNKNLQLNNENLHLNNENLQHQLEEEKRKSRDLQLKIDNLEHQMEKDQLHSKIDCLQLKNDCLQWKVDHFERIEGMFREKEELWRMIKTILEQNGNEIKRILESKDDFKGELINFLKEKLSLLCNVIQTFVKKYDLIENDWKV